MWTWAAIAGILVLVPWAAHTALTVQDEQQILTNRVRLIAQLDTAGHSLRSLKDAVTQPAADQAQGRARWRELYERYRADTALIKCSGPDTLEVRRSLDSANEHVQAMGGTVANILLSEPDTPERERFEAAFFEDLARAHKAMGNATAVAQTLLASVSRDVPNVWFKVKLLTFICCMVAILIGLVIRFYQRDVMRRQRAEQKLRESEERYALTVRGANDGLWDWNITRGEVYYAPRWKAMLGLEEDDLSPSPDEWFKRVHPDDLDSLRMAIAAHLEGASPHFEAEYRMLHADGTPRWMLSRGTAVMGPDGKPYRLAGSQTDVTARRKAEEQLMYDACHDALTGLPNRAMFTDRLGRALWRAKRRQNYMFAVLFLDLDRFKVINDSLGHIIGDQLLIGIARRLEDCLRPSDMVARLGGDEFTVLLEDIRDVSDATRVAERIQEKLSGSFTLGGQEVFTTVSIGIALNTTGYERAEDILRDADTAMYRAKAAGKACHEMFDRGMHVQAVNRLQMETDLRLAVENEQFRLAYQPVVDLDTGAIFGFEALIRWQHPKRGLVSPGSFIPLAEETGLIVPIGLWVLREACRQTVEWQKRFKEHSPLAITVNLSTKQFATDDLHEHVERTLEETGLDPRCLKLEITESLFLESGAHGTAALLRLKELGVDLYVDDFGTGYSTLGNLHRLPIDALKIDRSFVGRMGGAGENSELVRTIVSLAKNLGMTAIGEGVETAQQLGRLRAMGCSYAQGNFFSPAVPKDEAEAILAKRTPWSANWSAPVRGRGKGRPSRAPRDTAPVMRGQTSTDSPSEAPPPVPDQRRASAKAGGNSSRVVPFPGPRGQRRRG